MTNRRYPMHWYSCVLLAVTVPVAADQPSSTAPPKNRGLQGTWSVVSMEYQGKRVPSETYKDNKLVISPTIIITRKGAQVVSEAEYKVRPARKTAVIEWKEIKGPKKGRKVRGIYLLEGDTLKICAS